MNNKIAGLKQVAHKYKNYFFDLDGVIWRGQQEVPGSIQTLNKLRNQNKNLFFITNSSVRGRQALKNKFSRFNFNANIQECFPSAYFSTLYLKYKYPEIKKIMVFGTDDMAKQFAIHGFDVKHVVESPQFKDPIDIASQKNIDDSIQAIVVGWCSDMTFAKQCLIGFYIQKGVKFFGTNPDKFTMIGNYKIPGAGSIIASIQAGCSSKAQIIGKPNTFIIDQIIKQKQLKKQQCIMIGDNRETDIAFGNNAGISTLCVLSGVTNQDELTSQQKLNEKAIPTYYSNSIYQ